MRFLKSFFFAMATAGFALAALPGTVAATDSAHPSSATVVRVFTGWREGASFKRISEYFSGKENTGGAVVLRTHPDQRAGFYFFIRLHNPGAAIAVKANVEVITPTDKQTRDFSFATELKSGSNLFDVGLTGDDWVDPKANPVAWKIDFIAADGQIVASEKSYLWEKPGSK